MTAATNPKSRDGKASAPRARRSAILFATLAIPGALLTLSACASPDGEGEKQFSFPQDPQERIGAREHPLVLAKYGGEYKDEKIDEVLATIMGRLVEASGGESRIYKLTLLDAEQVNAFSLPGGFIYLTRGLLALASDSSEVAAVIAHEMAHIQANHPLLRKERHSGAKLGEEVAREILGDSLAAKVAIEANQLHLSDFSRDQELKADSIGIGILARARYDPRAAVRFLRKLQAWEEFKAADASEGSGIMASHPATPRRVERALLQARQFGGPETGERGQARYLDAIDGLPYGEREGEGFVRGRDFLHPGWGIAFSAPPGSSLRKDSGLIEVRGPRGAVTWFGRSEAPPGVALEEHMRSGWIKGVVEESISPSLTQSGLPAAVADARSGKWRFRIAIVRLGDRLHHFATAMEEGHDGIEAVARPIWSSFRRLSHAERAILSPLRIRIVEAGELEGYEDFVWRMQEVSERPEALFLSLNGSIPEAGERAKIVSRR